MIVFVDVFICWLEWFGADYAVRDVDLFPPLFLGQPLHSDIIGQVLSTDGCYGYHLVQKLFSSVIPNIHLGWFKVSPINTFHEDAVLTWYVMLILGGEGFWWR